MCGHALSKFNETDYFLLSKQFESIRQMYVFIFTIVLIQIDWNHFVILLKLLNNNFGTVFRKDVSQQNSRQRSQGLQELVYVIWSQKAHIIRW